LPLNPTKNIILVYADAPIVIEPTVEAVRKALMPDVG
jgi:hypothetical protein